MLKIKQLTIDVDSDLLERIEEAASFQGKHVNDMILDCIERHVEWQERITKQLRQNADNIRFGEKIKECAQVIALRKD